MDKMNPWTRRTKTQWESTQNTNGFLPCRFVERLTCFIPHLSVDHNAARKWIHPHILPESLISLRALLSEKEDISEAGLSAACSKPLKGTLQVYTTNSDSSGLSLDTPGCNHTNQRQHKMSNFLIYCIFWKGRIGHLPVLFLDGGFAFRTTCLFIWWTAVWWAPLYHMVFFTFNQDFMFEILQTQKRHQSFTWSVWCHLWTCFL